MRRLIVLLLLVFSTGIHAAHKSIYIILSSGDAVYYAIGSQLKDQISNPHLSVEQVKLVTLEGNSINDIKPDDLIISIGNKAAEKAYNYQSDNTVIYSFVEQEFINSIKPNNQSKQWAAVTVNQPVERLISIADNLVKNNYKNKIVILVSKNNAQLKRDINSIESLKKSQLAIIEIEPDDIVTKAIEKSLFNAAALIATDDHRIWSGSNAKWLLRQAYSYQVPVVGNSKQFLKAGALISVYSSQQKIAEATSKLVDQWLDTGNLSDTGTHHVASTIDVNKSVAQALRFNKDVLQALEVNE